MGWDELCLLTGICPSGGPFRVATYHYDDLFSREISLELFSSPSFASNSLTDSAGDNATSFTQEELETIVQEALRTEHEAHRRRCHRRLESSRPESALNIGYWARFEHTVAIGRFEENQNHTLRNATPITSLKVVSWTQDMGNFDRVVDESNPGSDIHRTIRCMSAPGTSHLNARENIFVLDRALVYLKAWLDADQNDGGETRGGEREVRSIEEELYIIANSQPKQRILGNGLLPIIEYGGMERRQYGRQDDFITTRQGCIHLGKAIKEGKRGEDLIPALLEDCKWWMWAKPNCWPCRTSPTQQQISKAEEDISTALSASLNIGTNSETSPISIDTSFSVSHSIFDSLPTEVFLLLIHHLPFQSLLNLALSNRAMYTFLFHPSTLNSTIRDRIHDTSSNPLSLRWLHPIPPPTLGDELMAAHRAHLTWLSPNSESDIQVAQQTSPYELFRDPDFPYLDFFKAVCKSDSMRNRERVWKIVKQYDVLWREHRDLFEAFK